MSDHPSKSDPRQLRESDPRKRFPGTRYRGLGFMGFPRYLVSEKGSVWSRHSGVWVRLKPIIGSHGYKWLTLCQDGRRAPFLVHRLVLLAFVGPCPEGMECRHLDGNRRNSRLSNLCWGTWEENRRDAVGHGTQGPGELSPVHTLTDAVVLQLRRLFATGDYTLRELGRRYGVSEGVVGAAVSGGTWPHLPGAVPEDEMRRIGLKNKARNPPRGERGGSALLTEKQVVEMRNLGRTGAHTFKQLEEKFGRKGVHDVLAGRTWAHVPGALTSEEMRRIGWEGRSRQKRGEGNQNAKLTEGRVRKIRDLYATGSYTLQELADRYGVGLTTVHFIVHRKTWRHLQ